MRILLDTHAFIWWLAGNELLSLRARAAIANPQTVVLISAATSWEIATKVRLGKLAGMQEAALDMAGTIRAHGFETLDITVEDGQRAGNLKGGHKDPFDRMLIAQALRLDIPLISNELVFDGFGIHRVW